jgi:hypothetical protein
MDRIKALGLFAGHLDTLRRDDAQARFLQHLGDGTRQVATRRIGLDDRKGTVRGHDGHGLLLWMNGISGAHLGACAAQCN